MRPKKKLNTWFSPPSKNPVTTQTTSLMKGINEKHIHNTVIIMTKSNFQLSLTYENVTQNNRHVRVSYNLTYKHLNNSTTHFASLVLAMYYYGNHQ